MMHLEIDRIRIALHGVSAEVVEAAVIGLEAELGRRLGSPGSVSRLQPLEIGELSLGPLHSDTVLDAGALRGVIADRLANAIHRQLSDQAVAGGRE
jgi:hypothetical protein